MVRVEARALALGAILERLPAEARACGRSLVHHREAPLVAAAILLLGASRGRDFAATIPDLAQGAPTEVRAALVKAARA
jgi:hypothetical protein